ncbi:hypothetical protein O0L34_g1060 [Tuta absoluta]|nr:hypothetical protein O0L34_g1060 [Tuta absoluta]
MAARYDVSPTEASSGVFWTLHNVWFKNFSQIAKKNHAVNVYSESNTAKQDGSTKTEKDRKRKENIKANSDQRLIAEADLEEDNEEEIRRNVWSDVDDELYIAEIIKFRTTNEVKREKRDTSGSVSEVVSSVKLEVKDMWDLEPTDLTECDCLGPPPEFLLPPPPRPPFLQTEYYCGDDPLPDLETCDTEPVSTLDNLYLH